MSNSAIAVTILTPQGRGAIATVLMSGAGAIAVADRHFRPASGLLLSQVPFNHIHFGLFQGTDSQEEIVAVATAADEVELHCHGGPAAADAIANTLAAAGTVRVTWPRIAEDSEDDRLRAEARCALAKAATERTCAILLDQYRGALGRELGEIQTLLANGEARCVTEARSRLDLLIDRWLRIGQHLTRPWRIVIAGPPNGGKSSLMNALLGYQRSITFDQPGTTRDVLTEAAALDGWPVKLVDTAGLRLAGDPLEAEGVERAQRELATADAVLAVVDMTVPEQPREWLRQFPGSKHAAALRIGNKSDLLSAGERHQWHMAWPDALTVSAKTGAGIHALGTAIVHRLVGDLAPAGAAVPFLPRHAEQIRLLYRQYGLGDLDEPTAGVSENG